MRNAIRLGRLFGIAIRVDWSWLFVFVLVTWNLASVFGQAHGDWASITIWGMSFASAILFFVSVLLHELAHSLVAQRRGIPVRSITLFVFGGVSDIQQEPGSAGAEFAMAIVGPLTSLAIGAACVLLVVLGGGLRQILGSSVTRAIASLSPASTALLWLGSVNTSLGIFNLIPGFPLDGGRVLRSILWKSSGDLRKSTRWASIVGQSIAWIFILSGIGMAFGLRIPYFGSGLASGLWLAFIGWFLQNAAVQSYAQVVVHDILRGESVDSMMRRDPPTVAMGSTVAALVHDHIMGTDDHCFPVMDGDRLVGLAALEDVRRSPQEGWETTTVSEIMTPREALVVAAPEDDAADAWDKLATRDCGQLPVVRDGQLLGMLRRQDLTKWLQLHAKKAIA